MAWRYIVKIKPYWDELNANSYHSGAIFDIATEKQIAILPFAYGDEHIAMQHAYDVVRGQLAEKTDMFEIRRMCFATLLTDSGEQDCRDYGKDWD